jgi:hypothetical protein
VWSFLDRETTYIGHSTYIDLHWRISSQRHLFPPFAKLYSRRTTVTVADTQIPTLCQADSLAAACYHAYFDQFQPLRSLIDVLSLIPAVSPESLAPDLPRPLQKLMAGVITVVTDEFPDLVDTQAQALLAVLPAPPRIVRKRFDQAVVTPRRAWEETQDQKALVAKLLSEAHFDSPFEVVPRFVGKRLLAFPAWSESQETTSLSAAVWRRWRVESARRPSTG